MMLDSLSTLADLLTRPDFQAGLLAGALGVGVLYGLSKGAEPARWWGGVFALAGLIVVNAVVGRRLGLSSGLFALAVGGWLLAPGNERRTTPLGWILVVIGAALVGWRGGISDDGWLRLVTPVAIVIGGGALSLWSIRLPHDLLGPMMAITAFGIWVTVPETEHARVFLGVAIPMALATMRPVRARISTAGAFALAGLLVWVVAVGGEARPASIIGGWASLGALAILPLVRQGAAALVERRQLVVIGIHVVFVVIASRLIGLWESAVFASVAVLALSTGAFLTFGSLTPRSLGDDRLAAHGPE